MTTVFKHPSELLQAEGKQLGASDWLTVDQDRINLFADATGDHQWIHVDPEKAKTGPFGATIAHGYLSLSLVNLFLPQIVDVQGISMGVNYGCDKVRFPAPAKVGSRLRGVHGVDPLRREDRDVGGGRGGCDREQRGGESGHSASRAHSRATAR